MNGAVLAIFMLGLVVFAGAALLGIGLIGRPRPTRPRCGACREPLGGVAVLPAACPRCAASLGDPGAVRFGGHRLQLQPLLGGVGIGILLVFPVLLTTLRGVRGTSVINGVVVERGVSEARFDEAMAPLDDAAWTWLAAHIQAEALDRAQRRRAGEMFVDALRKGERSGAMLMALSRSMDVVDQVALGEALLATAQTPEVVIKEPRSGLLVIEVKSAPTLPMLPFSSTPMAEVLAVTEIRIDGHAMRPRSPDGRVLIGGGTSTVVVEGVPESGVSGARRVEVDLVSAVVRHPPAWLRQHALPGPPEAWPTASQANRTSFAVLGLRRHALVVDVP